MTPRTIPTLNHTDSKWRIDIEDGGYIAIYQDNDTLPRVAIQVDGDTLTVLATITDDRHREVGHTRTCVGYDGSVTTDTFRHTS